MSHSQSFIPGKWLDQIDVHDFVQLNQNPFFESVLFFTQATERNQHRYNEMIDRVERQQPTLAYFFPSPLSYRGDTHSHLETFPYLLEQILSTLAKKALKSGLIDEKAIEQFPDSAHPDPRVIPLYGTKLLIRDKKLYLKQLDYQFQTTEWADRRLALVEEIQALERFVLFARDAGIDVREPASSLQEACDSLFITLLCLHLEQPSIAFALPDMGGFLDIYAYHDVIKGSLKEDDIQSVVDEWILKLLTLTTAHPLRFTLDASEPTVMTQRILESVRRYPSTRLKATVLYDEDNQPEFLNPLASDGVAYVEYDPSQHKNARCYYGRGRWGDCGADIYQTLPPVDLMTCLMVALNGGKHVPSNANFMTNTQPFKQDALPFSEVDTRFKDTLLYLLNIIVSLHHHVFYVSERYCHHPFRYSLLSNFHLYKARFSFTRFTDTMSTLTAIYRGDYVIKRNKKGWITEIEGTGGDVEKEIEEAYRHFFDIQIERLPLYKSGKGYVSLKGAPDERA